MPSTKTTGVFRKEMLIAAAMVAVGLGTSLMALAQLAPARGQLLAQATPPLQSTPGAESKPSAPAEPTTTGQRPQDTAPQPARPDADAQNSGAKPALPPAPAEKVAPPITAK